MGNHVSSKSKHSKPQSKGDEIKILQTYQHLLNMGFDESISFESAHSFHGNIEKCIEYITSINNANKANDNHHAKDPKINDHKSFQATFTIKIIGSSTNNTTTYTSVLYLTNPYSTISELHQAAAIVAQQKLSNDEFNHFKIASIKDEHGNAFNNDKDLVPMLHKTHNFVHFVVILEPNTNDTKTQEQEVNIDEYECDEPVLYPVTFEINIKGDNDNNNNDKQWNIIYNNYLKDCTISELRKTAKKQLTTEQINQYDMVSLIDRNGREYQSDINVKDNFVNHNDSNPIHIKIILEQNSVGLVSNNIICKDSEEKHVLIDITKSTKNDEPIPRKKPKKKKKSKKKKKYKMTEEEIACFQNANDNKCNSNEDVNGCISIKRMIFVLKIYNYYDSNYKEFVKFVNNTYSVTCLLNDYIHILESHDELFEDIFNLITFKCSLNKCNSLRRNQQNRFRINESRDNNDDSKQDVNDEYDDVSDIIDQMHCFFLHTFDIGFRLMRNEIIRDDGSNNDDMNIINNEFVKMNKILSERRKQYKLVSNLSTSTYSKFVTVGENKNIIETNSNTHDDSKQNETDTENQSNSQHETYSFSFRFYYWSYYEAFSYRECERYNKGLKYKDVLIARYYDSFKQELLQNEIFSVTKQIWKNVTNKAKRFMKTNKVKKLTNKRESWEDMYYMIDDGEPISIYHLMSIIFYCDYSELCYKFSETFRFIDSDNNNLYKLIQRHQNYYWFARYMRETVELYGKQLANDVSVHHGISQLMIFPSTVSYFNHPTSTTRQIIVARNFATDNGIIITLNKRDSVFSVPGFDCCWLSKYGNESEILFIGGYDALKIVNIIECCNGNQYSKYLSSLNKFIHTMNGEDIKTDINEFDKSLFDSLFCSNNAENKDDNDEKERDIIVPAYIIDIFDKYKQNKKFVTIDLDTMNNYFASWFLLKANKSFVDLQKMYHLFDNLTTIIIKKGTKKQSIPITSTDISLLQDMFESSFMSDWASFNKFIINNFCLENKHSEINTGVDKVQQIVNNMEKLIQSFNAVDFNMRIIADHSGFDNLCIEKTIKFEKIPQDDDDKDAYCITLTRNATSDNEVDNAWNNDTDKDNEDEDECNFLFVGSYMW